MVVFFQAEGALPYKESFLQGFARALQESGVAELMTNAILEKKRMKLAASEGAADRQLKREELKAEQERYERSQRGNFLEFITGKMTGSGEDARRFHESIQNPSLRMLIDQFGMEVGGLPQGQSLFQLDETTGQYMVSPQTMESAKVAKEAEQISVDTMKADLKRQNLANALKSVELGGVLSGSKITGPEGKTIAATSIPGRQVIADIVAGSTAPEGTEEYARYQEAINNFQFGPKSKADQLIDEIMALRPEMSETRARGIAFDFLVQYPQQAHLADMEQKKAYTDYLIAMTEKTSASKISVLPGSAFNSMEPDDQQRVLDKLDEHRREAAKPFEGIRIGNKADFVKQNWLWNPFDQALREAYEKKFNGKTFPVPGSDPKMPMNEQIIRAVTATMDLLGEDTFHYKHLVSAQGEKPKYREVSVTPELLRSQVQESYSRMVNKVGQELRFGIITPESVLVQVVAEGASSKVDELGADRVNAGAAAFDPFGAGTADRVTNIMDALKDLANPVGYWQGLINYPMERSKKIQEEGEEKGQYYWLDPKSMGSMK